VKEISKATDMTEEMTVLLAKEGRREAFRELYEAHREAVYRLAFRYVRSPQDAEDVMQETFIKAFRNIGRFDFRAGASFAAWLGTIGVRSAIEHIRRNKRRMRSAHVSLSDLTTEPASARPSPERLAIAGRAMSSLTEAYRHLSPSQRVVFDMRHLQHLDIKEIAARMGCNESTVKTQLARSVAKLRNFLEPMWGAS
jgi:RNA polymerase sigma-70 factor (ECF subfamily)